MSEHYDALETRDPRRASASSWRALPRQIAHAKTHAPAFARIAGGVDPATITVARGARAAAGHAQVRLARAAEGGAPVRRPRSDAVGSRRSVFASPGPIYEPEGAAPRLLAPARARSSPRGFRAGDLVHNCFSYHFTPAGSMLETGAHALGCTVFPGGTGQTEQQVAAMARSAARAATSARRRSSHHPRERRRARRDISVPEEGAWSAPKPSAVAARCAARARHRGYQVLRAAPTSARSPTRSQRRATRACPRRRRARRDRAAGHRRPGAPGEVGEVVVTPLQQATIR